MIRFWVEFSFDTQGEVPPGLLFGCGITARSKESALSEIQAKVFKGGQLPEVKIIIPDIDVATLDKGHVIPNMKPSVWPGIWYPLGYD